MTEQAQCHMHASPQPCHYCRQNRAILGKMEVQRKFPVESDKGASALTRQEGGDHYKDLAIQPIEYIHANQLPFAEGSIIKYVTRWRSKNGIKDLEKARHFIDLLIELETRETKK